jgi:hypothetical protein
MIEEKKKRRKEITTLLFFKLLRRVLEETLTLDRVEISKSKLVANLMV